MINSNFTNLKELLKVYHPTTRGVCTGEEVKLIEETLQLSLMEQVDLQNLRDFVVMYLAHHDDTMEGWDKMSAITHVIDKRMYSAEICSKAV